MSRNFLEGGKEQVSHLLEVLGCQTGNPKGLKIIIGNSGGEEVLTILEFAGHGR